MRGALIVGIDDYPEYKLKGCKNDATSLSELLKRNEDGTKNFSVILETEIQSRHKLRGAIIKLFKTELETALFYFAGHGCLNERGGFLLTPDTKIYDEGIPMDDVLNIVNQSKIKNKIVIIDCCHAGSMGEPVIIGAKATYLSEGVVIITACRRNELAMEKNGSGIFTSLLLDALNGGAADIGGSVTLAGVYAYIERSLSLWQQRPQFKSNVQRFIPLRQLKPFISVENVLKNITQYFASADMIFRLDPSYEYTNTAISLEKNIIVFKNLLQLNKAGLVEPINEEYMYFEAQNSGACRLTKIGKYYWRLIKEDII